jgi:hypothetical protein
MIQSKRIKKRDNKDMLKTTEEEIVNTKVTSKKSKLESKDRVKLHRERK